MKKTTTHPPLLVLSWPAFEEIALSIGSHAAETGGVLGSKNRNQISHFYFDASSQNSAVTYTPDHTVLNELFQKHWNPENVRLRGFIHSHPGHSSHPSGGDITYAQRILAAIEDIDELWLPIVNTIPDTGECRITPWLARQNSDKGIVLLKGCIQVLEPPAEQPAARGGAVLLDRLRPGDIVDDIVCSIDTRRTRATTIERATTCERVRDVCDLEVMHHGQVIVIPAKPQPGAKTSPEPGSGSSSPSTTCDRDKPRHIDGHKPARTEAENMTISIPEDVSSRNELEVKAI